MFEPFLIVPGSLVEVSRGGQPEGFAFRARCGYYRRLILSMVEALDIWVDGERVGREDVSFEVRGRSWRLDAMASEFTEAWEFGEEATLVVRRPGGLAPGEHRIRLREQLRISYLPNPDVADVERVETVGAAA